MRNRLLRDIFSALESAGPVSRADSVDEYRELAMLAGAWERGPAIIAGVSAQGESEATMNPLVSKVHGKEKRWSAEFAALRRLCLASGLNEELKWGQACYDLNGGNVVLIHGFKEYCALLFVKGALLKDPKGILIQQTRNVQAARQIRFASLADIRKQSATVAAYIKDAIAVEKSGAKVAKKTAAEYDVPQEFRARLADDPELAEAFRALTPGRQKGYLLHFAGAKQSATRAARVEKHVPRILKGLGLDD